VFLFLRGVVFFKGSLGLSRVSQRTFNKVAEATLAFLNERFPEPLSGREVAAELARDNEFVGRVLIFLREKGLVQQVYKSPTGKDYLRWTKWALTPATKAKFESL